MNIITNNCLGGFLYKNMLHLQYQNPFIWTLFKQPNEFITLVDQYQCIDFANIKLGNDSAELSNNFYLMIDGKIKLSFIHVHFEPSRTGEIAAFENTPRICGENLYTNRPWEYIVNKYIERLKRMLTCSKPIFMFFEQPKLLASELYRLPDICKAHKYPCLIFTEKNNIQSNEYATVCSSDGCTFPSQLVWRHYDYIQAWLGNHR